MPLAAAPDKADDAFELVDADDFDDLSDDDVEDLLFQFDRAGKAKPSALVPHLQAMVDGLKAGTAVLVDVRPVAEWNDGHLPFASTGRSRTCVARPKCRMQTQSSGSICTRASARRRRRPRRRAYCRPPAGKARRR